MLEISIKDPVQPAKACILWLHGLGADGSDMAGLAVQPELAQLPIRHVFLSAPKRSVTLNAGTVMRAWYDIYGLKISDREDKPGITASQELILQVLVNQLQAGFKMEQLFLAGFSQGGAMALYTALNSPSKLGGVITLSSYLPLSRVTEALMPKDTPIFIGSGLFDPIVLPDWTRQSELWLKAHQYEAISFHQYPMEHTICLEEVQDLAKWLATHINGVSAV